MKEEGDLGVEFAKPAVVRAALLAARDSTGSRAEFTKDDLLRRAKRSAGGESFPTYLYGPSARPARGR